MVGSSKDVSRSGPSSGTIPIRGVEGTTTINCARRAHGLYHVVRMPQNSVVFTAAPTCEFRSTCSVKTYRFPCIGVTRAIHCCSNRKNQEHIQFPRIVLAELPYPGAVWYNAYLNDQVKLVLKILLRPHIRSICASRSGTTSIHQS